jgi:hypothetical protein
MSTATGQNRARTPSNKALLTDEAIAYAQASRQNVRIVGRTTRASTVGNTILASWPDGRLLSCGRPVSRLSRSHAGPERSGVYAGGGTDGGDE